MQSVVLVEPIQHSVSNPFTHLSLCIAYIQGLTKECSQWSLLSQYNTPSLIPSLTWVCVAYIQGLTTEYTIQHSESNPFTHLSLCVAYIQGLTKECSQWSLLSQYNTPSLIPSLTWVSALRISRVWQKNAVSGPCWATRSSRLIARTCSSVINRTDTRLDCKMDWNNKVRPRQNGQHWKISIHICFVVERTVWCHHKVVFSWQTSQ